MSLVSTLRFNIIAKSRLLTCIVLGGHGLSDFIVLRKALQIVLSSRLQALSWAYQQYPEASGKADKDMKTASFFFLLLPPFFLESAIHVQILAVHNERKIKMVLFDFLCIFPLPPLQQTIFFRIDVHKNGRNHSVVLVSIKIRKL